MASEGLNPVLKQAKSLCYDTPEKTLAVKNEEEPVETKGPGPSPPKKHCNVLEKFVKKLPGDTSVVRDAWVARDTTNHMLYLFGAWVDDLFQLLLHFLPFKFII